MYSSIPIILFIFVSIVGQVVTQPYEPCRMDGEERVFDKIPKQFEVKVAFNLGDNAFGMFGTLTLDDGQQKTDVTLRMRFNMGLHIDIEPYFWELNDWPIDIGQNAGSKIVTAFMSNNDYFPEQFSPKLLFALYENGKVMAIDIDVDERRRSDGNGSDFRIHNSEEVYDKKSDHQNDKSGVLHVRHLLRHFPKGIEIQAITMFEAFDKTYAFVYTSEHYGNNENFLVKHIMVGNPKNVGNNKKKIGWKFDDTNDYCDIRTKNLSAVSYAFVRKRVTTDTYVGDTVEIKLIEFYGNTYRDFNINIKPNGSMRTEREGKEKNCTEILKCGKHFDDYTFVDKHCNDYKEIPKVAYDYYNGYFESNDSGSGSDTSYVWLYILAIIVVIAILVLVVFGFSYYFYYNKSATANTQSNNSVENQPIEQNVQPIEQNVQQIDKSEPNIQN